MDTRAAGAARLVARMGLVARTVFYLLLVYLVAQVAAEGGHGGREANAHGALTLVARNTGGEVALVAAAVGFAVFGIERLVGALRDRKVGRWRRVTTALQGLFYVALTWIPLSFVIGHRQTGTEQQQHAETAAVLRWPLGRELVAAAGVVVVAVCAWQIRTALTRSFDDGLDLRGQPRVWKRAVTVAGVVGIAARAVVFVPIGVFLVIAAVEADPRHADGLDAELARVAHHAWGPALLGLVAAGLLVFAAYSGIEARFRDVSRGV